MIPKDLQNLLERYCMGKMPTDAQMDEIMDMVMAKGADPAEVAAIIETLAQGPTREEMEAKRKAEEEERKRKEAEEAERKRKEAEAKAERERKEAERKRKEAEQKAERERIEAEKKRKEKEELAKKKAEEAKREAEAAKTAYMNIHKVEFANVKKDGEFITDFGVELNDFDMRYLKPRISYDSLLDKDKEITLYEKIVCPDGSIDTSDNSPEGFTRRFTITVSKGKGQKTSFSGWGSENKSLYDAGTYKYEIWYEGNQIYETSFKVEEMKVIITISKIDYQNMGNKKDAVIICKGVAKNIEKVPWTTKLQLYVDGIRCSSSTLKDAFHDDEAQIIEIKQSGDFEVKFVINELSINDLKLENGINSCKADIRWGEGYDDRKVFTIDLERTKHFWRDDLEIKGISLKD